MATVTLNFVPPSASDFVRLHVFEAPANIGPWTEIDSTTSVGTFPNYITTYTTSLAISVNDWFAIAWSNSSGAQTILSPPMQGSTTTVVAEVVRRALLRIPTLNETILTQETETVVFLMFGGDPYNPALTPTPEQYSSLVRDAIQRTIGSQQEIPSDIPAMASINDINAYLDNVAVTATVENTALLQISTTRIIRGMLSNIVDIATLASWNTPDATPDVIREVAGRLIAAQLYFKETSRTTTDIQDTHYSQRLYDEAVKMLNAIINGTILVPGIVETATENLSTDDFWPNSDQDRAFTLAMRLD